MTDYNPILESVSLVINNRIKEVLQDLCSNKYPLNYEDLCSRYVNSGNNKNKSKKSIEKGIRCMAKKADGKQCTRRRKIKDSNGTVIIPEVDYCGKHIKSIKYGRIDDDEKHKNNSDFIKTIRENIDGEYYLVDPLTDTVYSYNKYNPILIGKKINNELILVADLIKKYGQNKDIKFKINFITDQKVAQV
tara:strand:+ start:15 stop:584 length:570 start_codon:yes stop_codon:yes gene_type:complete